MAQNFPQIGLRAVFDISDYQKNYQRYQKTLRDMDKATQQAAQSMSRSGQKLGGGFAQSIEELAQKSQRVQNLLQALPTALEPLRDSFNNLGEGIGINVQKFEELVAAGASTRGAFEQSKQVMDSAESSSSNLAQTLFILSSAYQAVAPALRAAVRLVQVSISEYNELAEATRRLRHQTGLLSEEASGWVLATQATGLSAATAQRSLTQFLDKVVDLRREQASGKESTSDFARAIETLGVELQNTDGTLKTTAELLSDVEAGFRRLGPGALSAEAATALFGFSGRFLLPILQSTGLSLTKLMEIAEDYGATLNSLSQKEYEEFKRSQFELLVALQGVYNFIAKQWIPVLTQVQRIVASSISIWRTLVQIVGATERPARTLAEALERLADKLERTNNFLQRAATLAQRYRDILDPVGAAVRRAAEAEEKLAQARGIASLAAAEASDRERARQDAIDDTIEKLNELRTKLVEKLTDIDQDAQRKWDDIFVKRQRDAIDRGRRETFRMIDLQHSLDERMAAIEADFTKRWDAIFVKRQRDAILRGERLRQRFEDLARATEQRRQDAIRDAQGRERDLRRDAQRRVEDAERDARDRREKLERDHRRRLAKIQRDYLDTVTEAARQNDAVAVARAIRQRAKDIREERIKFADEQTDLQESLAKKREDIERDRKEREEDHRRELAQTLQRIEENRQRQLEAIVRQNQQERLLREIRYRWELEDLEAARAEQLQAADDWYDKQYAALLLAQAREALERKIQYDRQEKDFNDAWRRRTDDALEWYQKERDDLAAHLSLTGKQLEAIYEDWARTAAEAAAEVARAAADAIAEEIIRYQHLLTEAERARARATPVAPRALPPPEKNPYKVGPYPPGAPVFGMAEGGVVQASSPTHIMMGEGGPETGVFLPGGASRSMNVNHNFGRMGVDVQGLPGGMNAQQIEGLFYAFMTQLAKGIQVPRN